MSDNSFYGPLDDPAGDAGYSEHPPRVGFFTDTSVCIGCKACEVACKEWNGVPDDGFNLLGMSFDNTGMLGANTWRHVAFIEQPERPPVDLGMPGLGRPGDTTGAETRQDFRWLMSSDVCKHCTHAGCLDVCPTGALFRTEFGTVVVQQDICNGCGYCVSGCPYGVIERREGDGRAWKCTLCYDRLRDGLEPACAKACPTDSIQFGTVADLKTRAQARVQRLRDQGETRAQLYGADDKMLGGLNSFFLLVDRPEVYGLPPDPKMPSRNLAPSSWLTVLGGVLIGLAGIFNFRGRGSRP
jgi:formate dehydrogenase iron-sulfur subunit